MYNTNKIEKLGILLLELTLLEICAQNQGNSIYGDLKCKNFLGGHAPRPPWKGSPLPLNNHYPA